MKHNKILQPKAFQSITNFFSMKIYHLATLSVGIFQKS
jgi:hypothetical protein